MRERILSVGLSTEEDVVSARQRADLIAELMGFNAQDRTRIATAVSEIARNALIYADGGKVEFWIESHERGQALCVATTDKGPGISDLDAVLDGSYESTSGMGVGILGSEKLMHELEVESGEEGTRVVMRRYLPREIPKIERSDVIEITRELARSQPRSPIEEVQRQNQELLTILDREREAREMAERATKARDDFFATLSHELRTPLTSILGWAEILRTSPHLDAEDDSSAVEAILSSGKALKQLIEQLLDVSRIMLGKFTLDKSKVNIVATVREAVAIVSPIAESRGIALDVSLPDRPVVIEADSGRMLQVFWNLLTNAVKFSPYDSTVSVDVSPREEEVIVRVRDEGEGIEPEMLEKIFERLQQVISGEKGGMGIGLSLVSQIVSEHGGTVLAESDGLGTGATFTVRLPR